MDDETRRLLDDQFTADERRELGLSMAIFHGVSKLLIVLGCEPEQMDITVLPTPGSASR